MIKLFSPYSTDPINSIVIDLIGPVYETPQKWIHSPKCTQEISTALIARQEWQEQWPNHCTKCYGWGIHENRDSVPYGCGNVTMTTNEPCENCLEQGCCPRCGEMILATDDQFEQFFDNEELCPLCGWSWGRSPGDIEPEVPECYCWEI